MNSRKIIYITIALLVILGAAYAFFLTSRPSRNGQPGVANANKPAPPSTPADSPGASGPADSRPSAPGSAQIPTSFLGTLAPGASADAATREGTYVVSYQVAFFRKNPREKAPEEDMTYQQLQAYPNEMSPYLFYGENVTGKADPAHPESIAVHAAVDGKAISGYIDAAKLWLEPPLDRPESDHFMVVSATTSVYVVPDPASPAVLQLLQGEVVPTVGALKFQDKNWIKARFNETEHIRYGFIPASDVKALTPASVNQSVVSLDEIPSRIRASNLAFVPADRQRLAQNGFYIEPLPPRQTLNVDDMADAYRDEPGTQFFVTSDLFLHSYHLIFDRMLQDIEEKKILPAVTKMSAALAAGAENELKTLPEATAFHDAALDHLVYFSVAAKLFNPAFAVAAPARARTDALVAAITAGNGEAPTHVKSSEAEHEDFTQYKVRGHYEKNESLRRYFRGMMWLGRYNFLLSDNAQTLAGMLLPSVVEQAHQTRAFESVDALTTYLIGRQDKYTLAGYRSVNQKLFGTPTPAVRELAANLDQNIATFQQTAWSDLPAPRIVSVETGLGMTQEQRLRKSAGLKFLGQRYVLDAFLLNQLTSPSVGSDQNPRNLPSALDIMMLLGSGAATDLQQKIQKQRQWPNYDRQVEKLKTNVEDELAKPSTFYVQWLAALKTLFLPTASKQMFALKEPWQYKNLNAGLASWTELKHDTILYAEQSAAEQGEGGEFEIPPYVPPGPKGYMEPNPAFFRQLVASIDQMLPELKRSDFITEEYVDKFTLFRDLANRAAMIAQKEIGGEEITREDFQWIAAIQYAFDGTLLLPRDVVVNDPSLLQMALVADVATDAVSRQVLEEGIGTPQRLVVVVKDAWGGTRLTVGFVYSWFEFPSDKRWSDSEWKKPIYGGDEKSRKEQGIVPPSWYSVFMKAGAGAS